MAEDRPGHFPHDIFLA